jgi:hypothetical protein
MTENWIYENLCYFDLRNPNGVKDAMSIYDEKESALFGNHAKLDCFCDNCFYGKSKMAEYILNLNNIKNK